MHDLGLFEDQRKGGVSEWQPVAGEVSEGVWAFREALWCLKASQCPSYRGPPRFRTASNSTGTPISDIRWAGLRLGLLARHLWGPRCTDHCPRGQGHAPYLRGIPARHTRPLWHFHHRGSGLGRQSYLFSSKPRTFHV